MKFTIPPCLAFRAAGLLLSIWLLGLPIAARAATPSDEVGVPLLMAQLPAGTNIPGTTCEQPARAVGRATLAHRSDAVAVLTAALTNGIKKETREGESKRPCACVIHIFRVSVAAAPAQASALLEAASSLYPDCAEGFAAVVDHADDKNVADDKNGPVKVRPVPSGIKTASNDTTPGFGAVDPEDPGDLNDRDNTGLGFGGGFGPGFPGSPGFTGSPPSSGIALPQPVVVTAVRNG